ncbi:MAG: urease accessory protein UreF [Rubrivivax sp.]|jgi:urease accessory protein|nr:urease accessory protein UreF [Rubrivivax sp.]
MVTSAGASPQPATLLRLMWMASPALPVGGFSYSEGLESAVDAGLVRDEASAGDWLLAQMDLSQTRSDWPVCAEAHRAWQAHDMAQVQALNEWVLHTRESAELRLQTEQMGRSLTEWLRRSAWPQPDRLDPSRASADATADEPGAALVDTLAALRPAPTWPVAFALAGLLSGASTEDTLLACAFSWAENMAQAAIKAVPLGQSGAQRVLQRLVDVIPARVNKALAQAPAERQSFAPMLAILSSHHEVQYSRLFRS